MKTLLDKIAREHPLAFAAEALMFVMFFGAFLFMATLRSSASTWSMIPHALINAGMLALVARHYLQGRPHLYWGHFDFVVAFLFLWLVVNIHFSEIRAVSWRSSALYLDSFGAYLFGRLLFYQRLRMYAIALPATLALVWLGAGDLLEQARRQEEVSFLLVDRMEGLRRICLLAGGFWLLSIPFISARRPSNLLFLLYVALVVGAYALVLGGVYGIGWLLESGITEANVTARHERLQNLETAWRIIRNYPLTGSGLGTFPYLFDAYRESLAVPYLASFSSYLYCLVEAGLVAVALVLYLLVRLPLHAVRRWVLFPNRRLRMAVVVFMSFVVLSSVHGIIDAAAFTPAAWFLFWSGFGVLVSLVVIRDPVQIFETAFAWRGAVVSGVTRAPEREFRPLPGSAFARTALGTLRRRKIIPREKKVRRPAGPLRKVLPVALVALLVIGLTVAESLPYLAARMARVRPGETVASDTYLERLERSAELFPFSSDVWAQIGETLRQRASTPLEILRLGYAQRIETSYLRAISANPYRPQYYWDLYQLYRDTNNPYSALETMKLAVRNNPNDLRSRLLLVRELEREGSLALASYHVKQAVTRIAPDQVELYLRLAELYEQRGMRDKARRWLQYARQVVPDTPEAQARLKWLTDRLG